MAVEKRYRILFILNGATNSLHNVLPDVCNNIIKMGQDVHVIYSPQDIDGEFEVSLRSVPWIHACKLPVTSKKFFSQISNLLAIRSYIKKHDGMDVIHSFGLHTGILSYIATLGLQAANINTPDKILNPNAGKIRVFSKFILDNLTYIFNRLFDKILFISEEAKNNSARNISYKNLECGYINFSENNVELGGKLFRIYTDVVNNKNTSLLTADAAIQLK